MTIPGLKSPEATSEARPFLNTNDSADVAIEALSILGRIDGDRDEIREVIAGEFATLASRFVDPGLLYVLPPLGTGFTFDHMVSAVDQANYYNYAGANCYRQSYPIMADVNDNNSRLWSPGGSYGEGYSTKEINRLNVAKESWRRIVDLPEYVDGYSAQIALLNEPRLYDSLLHFSGLPFDGMLTEEGEPTQLTALAECQSRFNEDERYQALALSPINPAGLVMLTLQARIKGEEGPLQYGSMHFPSLGRKNMAGYPTVGIGGLNNGRLEFSSSFGFPSDHIGIGLSASQTS